jgi:tetratricopeptide (TPR) repeat protein
VKALISGQAAAAVLIDSGRFYSLTLDQPDRVTERTEWEVAHLLADAGDILQIENAPQSRILEELEVAWEKDRGLQLFLILLDPREEIETRVTAAECLDEFLSSSVVQEFLANRLYSAPLPAEADVIGAKGLCLQQHLEGLMSFIQMLEDDQEEIQKRHATWSTLPASLFESPEDKNLFYFDAVRFGAFRVFATERGRKNWAILHLLSHPYFRGNAKARRVFQEWAAPFRESATGTEFEYKRIEEDQQREIAREARREETSVRPREAFEQVEKQREAIKALLQKGDEDLALRYTEQLITKQRVISDPEHIAKSLCDLAQFAKSIGSPELQLVLAQKAINEVPSDAWSHATVGDAYRALYDYQKALDAYHQCGVLGDVYAALIGRAEVLKDLGQMTDSLNLLERCIQNDPSNVVSRNAKAAALADFGRFNESLESYDRLLVDWPYDQFALTGHAQVLKELGHLDEALREIEHVILWFPNNAIPQYTRGAILRELGRLEDALKAFEELKSRFPLAAEVYASYAKVLRDLGRFDEAIQQFAQLKKSHPLNPLGYIGLAETFRKLGELDQAHGAYDLVIEGFPRLLSGRSGKASVFMVQGDYANAIKLLPSTLPASISEWVAYHIRAMGYLRAGKLQRAERMFEWGVAEVSWAMERQYFKTALAHIRLQQGRFDDSITLAQDVTNPSVTPVAQALLMHARGALGDSAGVERAYHTIADSSAPIVISLRDHLAARYLLRDTWQTDPQLFVEECDSLLLAA